MPNASFALSEDEMARVVAWRRQLHRRPELSGEEEETAQAVCAFLMATDPDRLVTGLGGFGVAVVYEAAEPGPTIMVRAELDALPIQEISAVKHRSGVPGRAHLCGHDGHMAILAALGHGLGRDRPARGRVVLMFQPAEETGAGAAAVIRDPRFRDIAPDLALACHNMPSIPFGHVALTEGPVNCASRGMRIRLTGKTAHASQPETGLSPMAAVSGLLPALTGLGHGSVSDRDFALVTITHARMGEPSHGVAPGEAEIWATLRTLTDGRMAGLAAAAEALAQQAAAQHGLELAISYHDVFDMVANAPEAVAHLRQALDAEGIPHDGRNLPFRASEDFGRFGQYAPAAMFFLGAGEDHPSLHNPDYDFPDALIGIAARVFMRAIRDVLGAASEADAAPSQADRVAAFGP